MGSEADTEEEEEEEEEDSLAVERVIEISSPGADACFRFRGD